MNLNKNCTFFRIFFNAWVLCWEWLRRTHYSLILVALDQAERIKGLTRQRKERVFQKLQFHELKRNDEKKALDSIADFQWRLSSTTFSSFWNWHLIVTEPGWNNCWKPKAKKEAETEISIANNWGKTIKIDDLLEKDWKGTPITAINRASSAKTEKKAKKRV